MIGGKLLGASKLRRELKVIERRVEFASPMAVAAGAQVIEEAMHRLAPAHTGKLRAAITTDVESFGGGATARIGSDVPYDPFVQRGTVYMDPQAYGEEAAARGAPAVVAAMAKAYRAVLPN